MKKTGSVKRGLALLLTLAMLVTTLLSGLTVHAAEGGHEDFAAMRQKFYDMAVGGSYDAKDERLQPILESINATAQLYWDKMNHNPVSNAIAGSYRDESDKEIAGLDASQDYIFAEYPLGRRRPSSTVYINANSIHFTFQYLRAMALAYETKGCELYHNQEMLADIKASVKFVYDNHFNPTISRYGNWFSWQIGAPVYLGETLMLLYDEFTPEEIETYATAMIHFLGKTTMTGANATWTERVRMYAGILLEDAEWLNFVQSRMPGMLSYTKSGDGYYTDGTFVQHDKITYNGGYGLMCLTDSAYILYMLSDSPWALGEDSANIVYQWVYDNYEPFVYEGLAMDAFRGREITRYDTTQPRGGLIIANAILMLAESAPAGIAQDFKGMVKQWFDNELMIDEMNSGADTPWYKFPLDTVVKVNSILDDGSITPRDIRGTNYQMSAGARTIHWRDDWTYTIAMTSKRIANCEIGDSNAKGWYTGFGMTHLYNSDSARYEGVNKATIDWLRLPGSTSYTKAINSGQLNERSFVGGATDGVYGVSGMDLAMSRYSLEMKKSWFMFDDEVVALGSGISGSSEMETTFENYMLKEGNRTYSVDGQQKTMTMDGETLSYPGAKTMHMQGNAANSDIGFYFPQGADLNVKSETRTGKWSDLGEYNTDTSDVQADYFTAWQSHGAKPADGGYAYVMLPGKSDAQTASYAAASDIEILQQDENAHAVYEKTLGTLGVNFWKDGNNSIDAAGVSSYLSADSAASIMVSENDDVMDVSVSDATQENKGVINVEINRAAKGVLEADEGVEIVQSTPTIKLKVNVAGSAGKSFHVKLSYDEVALQPTEILSTQMVDDALVVTLKSVPNADSYDVRLGTETGVYTKTVNTKETTVNVYGLTPGETYYIAAAAKNADGESALSEEVTFTVPATTSFFDDFENFDKMLSYTSGWLFDAGDPGKFNQDITRLKRAAQNTQSFTYMLPGLQNFELETYGYNKSIGVIKLYTSKNGEDWTEQAYKTLGTVPKDDQWYKEVLSPDGAVNAGADYLKIELQSHPTKAWAPQFTKFNATMRNSSDQKTLKDPLLNDSRIYQTKNVEFVQNSDPGLYEGDTDVVKTAGADSELLYSWTGIQNVSVTGFAQTGGLTVSASPDGVSYTPVDLTKEEPGNGKFIFSSDLLPAGTNYLKLFPTGDMVLSEVSMDYKPDNTPIQYLRFAESALDGVIGYDASPLIKVAPMNGVSELIYTTLNEDVAKYQNGTLQFNVQGETKAIVTIKGTDTSAELPLTVYKNLCLKKPVEVSSVNSVYAASKAVDGDMTVSRWQSGTEDLEWIKVDMGPGSTFDAVDIQWYANGTDYSIDISNDDINWENIKTVSSQESGGYVRFDFDTPQSARYLRVKGDTPHQYSLFEVRALQREGDGSVDVEPWNLSIGKSAAVSESDPNDKSLTPEKAIDGSETTRWASGRNDNQWYTVDLGGVCEVNGINILWEGAAGKEYKVQISDGGTDGSWTDMVHEKNNTGAGWKRYSLPQTYTGRYVRMLGVSRVNSKYGYSMYEFEIMGVDVSQTQPLPFTEISLSAPELNLLKGQSAKITAATKPQTNALSVAWKSSDPDIISVNNSGTVTARGDAGSATITAYSVLDESVKAECVVSITPYAGAPVKVESVKITDTPDGVLYMKDSFALTAQVLPENASNKNVSWESSDPTVAVVNAGGVLTGLKPGKTVITAKSVSSGLTDSFEVEVEERTFAVTIQEQKPDTVPDAVITADPAVPVKAGTAVTIDISRIPEGYVLKSLKAVYGENQNVSTAEITEGVPEGHRQFLVRMPEAPITVTALITADKSDLQALINEAETKVESAYTAGTWQALSDALDAARDVAGDDTVLASAVSDAADALRQALDGLILKEDDEAMTALLADVNKALGDSADSLYDETVPADERGDGSFAKNAYDALKALAEEAQGDAKPTKERIEALTAALETFRASKVLVDTTELDNLLASAEELQENDYTPESWSALDTAVTAASKLLTDGGYSQKEVTGAWSAVNSAKTDLIRQFAIQIGAMEHGSIEAGAYVPQGGNAVLTVSPDAGYRLKSLTVGGVDVTGAVVNNEYTVENVQSAVEVVAEFEKFLASDISGRPVEITGGNLPGDATLSGTDASTSGVKIGGYKVLWVSDLALKDGEGAPLQPAGPVQVRMQLPEALYEAARNGELTAFGEDGVKIEAKFLLEGENWFVEYETDRIGRLILAVPAQPAPDQPEKPSIPGGTGSDWEWPSDSTGSATTAAGNTGKENPGSGDGSQLPIALALLAASAGAALLLIRKKK